MAVLGRIHSPARGVFIVLLIIGSGLESALFGSQTFGTRGAAAVDPLTGATAALSALGMVSPVYFGLKRVADVVGKLRSVRSLGVAEQWGDSSFTSRDIECINLTALQSGLENDKSKCSPSSAKHEKDFSLISSILDGKTAATAAVLAGGVSPVAVWARVEAGVTSCMAAINELQSLLVQCSTRSWCEEVLKEIRRSGAAGLSIEKIVSEFEGIESFWNTNMVNGDNPSSFKERARRQLNGLNLRLKGLEGGRWRDHSGASKVRSLLKGADESFPGNMSIRLANLMAGIERSVRDLNGVLVESVGATQEDSSDVDGGAESETETEKEMGKEKEEEKEEEKERQDDDKELANDEKGAREMAVGVKVEEEKSAAISRDVRGGGDVISEKDISNGRRLGFTSDFYVPEDGTPVMMALLQSRSQGEGDWTAVARSSPTVVAGLVRVILDVKRLLSGKEDYKNVLNTVESLRGAVEGLEEEWATLMMCTDFVATTVNPIHDNPALADGDEAADGTDLARRRVRIQGLADMSIFIKVVRLKVEELRNSFAKRFASTTTDLWDVWQTIEVYRRLMQLWREASRPDRKCSLLLKGIGQEALRRIIDAEASAQCPLDPAGQIAGGTFADIRDRYALFSKSQFTVDVASLYTPEGVYHPLERQFVQLVQSKECDEPVDCSTGPGAILAVEVAVQGEPTWFYFRVPTAVSRTTLDDAMGAEEGMTRHICNTILWRSGGSDELTPEAAACQRPDRAEWITDQLIRAHGRRKSYHINPVRGNRLRLKSYWYHARREEAGWGQDLRDNGDRHLNSFYTEDFDGDDLREPKAKIVYLRLRAAEAK